MASNMNAGLSRPTADVSGAPKGIGRVVAEGLVAEGCGFQIVSRIRETIERAAREIQARLGRKVTVHAFDCSTIDGIENFLDAAGDADMVVNNVDAIPGDDLPMIV